MFYPMLLLHGETSKLLYLLLLKIQQFKTISVFSTAYLEFLIRDSGYLGCFSILRNTLSLSTTWCLMAAKMCPTMTKPANQDK